MLNSFAPCNSSTNQVCSVKKNILLQIYSPSILDRKSFMTHTSSSQFHALLPTFQFRGNSKHTVRIAEKNVYRSEYRNAGMHPSIARASLASLFSLQPLVAKQTLRENQKVLMFGQQNVDRPSRNTYNTTIGATFTPSRCGCQPYTIFPGFTGIPQFNA